MGGSFRLEFSNRPKMPGTGPAATISSGFRHSSFYLLPTIVAPFRVAWLPLHLMCRSDVVSISISITVILSLVTEASIFHGRLAVLPRRWKSRLDRANQPNPVLPFCSTTRYIEYRNYRRGRIHGIFYSSVSWKRSISLIPLDVSSFSFWNSLFAKSTKLFVMTELPISVL
mgnify:CR=1 FL=1